MVHLYKLIRHVLHWAPIWIPVVLIWQITTAGLRPALAEHQRLRSAEPGVVERHRASKTKFEQLEAEFRAWHDPGYRERRRRAMAAKDKE